MFLKLEQVVFLVYLLQIIILILKKIFTIENFKDTMNLHIGAYSSNIVKIYFC